MRHQKVLLAAVLALTLMPAGANAGVSVQFIGAERYSDAEAGSSGSRAATLNELRRHFNALGARYLGAGRDLIVEVLDIDLAGERVPRGVSDLRIVTGAASPRIELRYTLRERGRVVLRAHETLSDTNFQMRADARRSGDSLAYEKEMITDWFRARFGAARRTRS